MRLRRVHGDCIEIMQLKFLVSKFARVVKGVDLRSTGRRPRGFEPHSLHYHIFALGSVSFAFSMLPLTICCAAPIA